MSGEAHPDDGDDLATAFGSVFGNVLGHVVSNAARPEVVRDSPVVELPAHFDEIKYVRAFPDVAGAIETGTYSSGRDHYTRHGYCEGRLDRLDYQHGWPIEESARFPPFCVDSVTWTASGRVLVIGWIDDRDAPLASLSLLLHQTLLGVTNAIARCRREDAERKTASPRGALLGFWAVFTARTDVQPDDLRVVLMTTAGQRSSSADVQRVSGERLRDLALEYLAHASYWGNPQVESFVQLERGVGDALICLNQITCAALVAGAFCRRFGPERSNLAGSVIVCLYGRIEYLFLQAALFTTGQQWEEYEFVYACNSPELAEPLLKEAALAAQIYGLSIAVVILPGNVGFGAANNAAVAFARTDRILIVNPDVFPRASDWASRHTQLVASLPEAQTRVFGVPLYYDDGSMMHGGMFFELDEGLSVGDFEIKRCNLARVEHYAKGAPPRTERFLRSRAVPAITGAFISIARGWFEQLGGFSPGYVFGHYEDADLCLRSLAGGIPVWIHDIPFWHMEGKGSTRRPIHEGGSLINRWHFTRSWTDMLGTGLLGPAPARFDTP